MKDLLIVAKFTMLDTIKRKSFIISNIIILSFVVAIFNIPNLINLFSGKFGSNDKILIVDENNIYEGALESLNTVVDYYDFEILYNPLSFDEIKYRIDDDIDKVFVINSLNNVINIDYYVDSISMMIEDNDEVVTMLMNLYREVSISKLGLTESELSMINPQFNVLMKQTDDKEIKGNQLVIMLVSILLFYAIYFCAYQVSNSITTEKTSKIIETLVTSTSPKVIVLGKTIGVGFVGVLQLISIILTAIISNYLFLDADILSSLVDVTTITPFLGFVTILYFILGYSFYALLFALTGSTVSKPEDVQSANTPIMFLVIGGFYLSYFTMMNPNSELGFIAGILPISAPFSVPFRVMMDVASLKELILSIGILLVTILIIARISIRIYSQAILNTGSKLSFKEIINMYKNKNI